MNYDPTDPDKMRLPTGKTCGDCAHIRRCMAIFGHVETDKHCDWSPSRFVEVRKAGATVVRAALSQGDVSGEGEGA